MSRMLVIRCSVLSAGGHSRWFEQDRRGLMLLVTSRRIGAMSTIGERLLRL